MSLRDQLLKAGLVSQDKVQKTEAEARKQTHQAKKNSPTAASQAAQRAEEQRRRETEAERKRERDRQLNQVREAQKRLHENAARARQLIESNRLNDPQADMLYYLCIDERRIRSVRVTRSQLRLLATGCIGVARSEDEYDFPLLARETALKVAEICPEKLLLLHPESDGSELEKAD